MPADTDIPPPPRPREYEGMDRTTGTLLLAAGVALVVVGMILLANPFAALWILAVLVGLSLVLGGAAAVVASRGRGGAGWAGMAVGVAVIVVGIAAVAWPDATVWVIALLAGVALVGSGAVTIALAMRGGGERGFALGLGVVSLVVGVIVLAWPEATLLVVAILIGLRTVLAGALFIGMGWNIRRLGPP